MRKMLSLTLGIALLAAAGTAYAATTDSTASTDGTATPPAASSKMYYKQMGKGYAIGNNTELQTLLGMDQATLAQELAAGKSLAAVAEAKGISKDKVVELLYNQEAARLDQMVTDGKVTQAYAEQQKAAIKEKLAVQVEKPGFGSRGGRGDMMMGGGKGGHMMKRGMGHGVGLSEAAGIIGLTEQEIKEQLQAGKSLSEIAQEKGITEDQLVNSLTDKAKEKIKQYVGRKGTAKTPADASGTTGNGAAGTAKTASL